MATPIVLDAVRDLATSTTSQRFDGHAFGGVPLSFFINHTAPGEGVSAHRHPYAEVFVLLAGEGTFVVDGEEHAAHGGQVVVVPATATHAFRNSGTSTLDMLSIHPAALMVTEWEPDEV
jgi:quercetin dioxygenase-like cupin family protein